MVIFDKSSQRHQVSEGRIINVNCSENIHFPRESVIDCMAETVAVVFSLPLAAIGHVIYSLAGHVLDLDFLATGKFFYAATRPSVGPHVPCFS